MGVLYVRVLILEVRVGVDPGARNAKKKTAKDVAKECDLKDVHHFLKQQGAKRTRAVSVSAYTVFFIYAFLCVLYYILLPVQNLSPSLLVLWSLQLPVSFLLCICLCNNLHYGLSTILEPYAVFMYLPRTLEF